MQDSWPTPAGRIVIAGGSGFLGRNLARAVAQAGAEAVVLSRSDPGPGPWRHARWDARSTGAWTRELDGAAGVVNLAGRSVDCIKSPPHCDEILRSRVESVRALGRGLREVDQPPPVWVQMSTAHIYGDPPEVLVDESAAFGFGLAPTVARAWEDALAAHALPGQRTVVLRTSFVLGRTGGALRTLGRLARWGLGGRIASGRQGMSWLHEDDMNRIAMRALTDASMRGPYLTTAPEPVSQADFMRALRRAVGMPIGLPSAEWMVRFGARWLLRTDPELALYGRYCVPQRLLDEGFEFAFADLRAALASIYEKR